MEGRRHSRRSWNPLQLRSSKVPSEPSAASRTKISSRGLKLFKQDVESEANETSILNTKEEPAAGTRLSTSHCCFFERNVLEYVASATQSKLSEDLKRFHYP